MESLERQLIEIGYEPYEAEKLYELYERQGKLSDLRNYIQTKQEIGDRL